MGLNYPNSKQQYVKPILPVETSKKTSKYGNQKVELDDLKFDSKKEMARFQELKLLEKAGQIKDLKVHPKYVLFPAVQVNLEKLSSITYIADFEYYDTQRGLVTEDVKSDVTRGLSTYRLKRNLFIREHPEITFCEV